MLFFSYDNVVWPERRRSSNLYYDNDGYGCELFWSLKLEA